MTVVSPFIHSQFPEEPYLQSALTILAERYFEHLESGELQTLLSNLDIDDATANWIRTRIQSSFVDIPSDPSSALTVILKHKNDIFGSKGSADGVDLLFRVLFGVSADVRDVSNDILTLNDANWRREKYVEVAPNDYQTMLEMDKHYIYGANSAATGFVESVVTKILYGKVLYIMYLSGVSGNFQRNEKIFPKDMEVANSKAPLIIGSLNNVDVLFGGRGFSVGDIFEVEGELGQVALARAIEVEAARGTLNFNVDKGGFGFSTDDDITEVRISDVVVGLGTLEFYDSSGSIDAITIPVGYNAVMPLDTIVVSNPSTGFFDADIGAAVSLGTSMGKLVSKDSTNNTIVVAHDHDSDRFTAGTNVTINNITATFTSATESDISALLIGVRDEGFVTWGLYGPDRGNPLTSSDIESSPAYFRVDWTVNDSDVKESKEVYVIGEVLDVHTGGGGDFQIEDITDDEETYLYTDRLIDDNNPDASENSLEVYKLDLDGRNSNKGDSVESIHIEHDLKLGYWITEGHYATWEWNDLDNSDDSVVFGWNDSGNTSAVAEWIYEKPISSGTTVDAGHAIFGHDGGNTDFVVNGNQTIGTSTITITVEGTGSSIANNSKIHIGSNGFTVNGAVSSGATSITIDSPTTEVVISDDSIVFLDGVDEYAAVISGTDFLGNNAIAGISNRIKNPTLRRINTSDGSKLGIGSPTNNFDEIDTYTVKSEASNGRRLTFEDVDGRPKSRSGLYGLRIIPNYSSASITLGGTATTAATAGAEVNNRVIPSDTFGGTNSGYNTNTGFVVNGNQTISTTTTTITVDGTGSAIPDNSTIEIGSNEFTVNGAVSAGDTSITIDSPSTEVFISDDDVVYNPPTVYIGSNNGSGTGPSVATACMSLGLEKDADGSIHSKLIDLLNYERATVGTISRLSRINPGENYSTPPFVSPITYGVSGLKQFDVDIVLGANVAAYQLFGAGEYVTQSIDLDDVQELTLTGDISTIVVGQGVVQSSSSGEISGIVVSLSGQVLKVGEILRLAAGSSNKVSGSFTMGLISVEDDDMLGRTEYTVSSVDSGDAVVSITGLVEPQPENYPSNWLRVSRKTTHSNFVRDKDLEGPGGSMSRIADVHLANTLRQIGVNSYIAATTHIGNGIVSKLALLDSGFGFANNEDLTLVPKDVETDLVLSGSAIVQYHGTGEGYWMNQRSFLNDKMIHDNDIYQEFSHEIITKVPPNFYRDILDTLVHPAGYRLSYVVGVNSVGEELVGPSCSVITKINESVLGTWDNVETSASGVDSDGDISYDSDVTITIFENNADSDNIVFAEDEVLIINNQLRRIASASLSGNVWSLEIDRSFSEAEEYKINRED